MKRTNEPCIKNNKVKDIILKWQRSHNSQRKQTGRNFYFLNLE